MPGLGAVTGPLGSAGTSQPNTWLRGQTIKEDATDTLANLDLDTLTSIAAQKAAGAPPFKKPAINIKVDGALKWQIGADVGHGTFGSASDERHDFYLLHKWTLDPTKSADIFYIPDEQDPRVNIMSPGSATTGQLHVHTRVNTRPVLTLNHGQATVDTWAQRFDYLDGALGGFWVDSTTAPSLRLGIGLASKPAYALDVRARAQIQDLQLAANRTAYLANEGAPLIYATASGGTYPFDNTGNIVYQPRSSNGTFAGSHVFVAGRDAGLLPALLIEGGSTSTTKNVAINPDPAAPAALFGTASGVLGLRNAATSPPNTSAGRPVNGAMLWVAGQLMRARMAAGETVTWGAVRSGGESGLALGFDGVSDTKILRLAAGVFALGNSAMTAPTMTGHGLMFENVTTAPSTNPVGGPVVYAEAGALKVRGTSGTVTVLGPA